LKPVPIQSETDISFSCRFLKPLNQLDKLKELLFGVEKQELESVAERIGELEKQTSLADTLPETIEDSYGRGPRLVQALRKPVEECLSTSVRENPEEISNALFPVMGPAIRKAVRESLRAFAQQLNQAIDNSLTPKGLRWRIQAWRAGVPFGDFVLRRTLLYRVEHAYLIQKHSGLLLQRAHLDAAAFKDDDAVSAMLTAIQEFVKDSFVQQEAGRLETVGMGEYTLWAVHGPDCMLACLIRGVPPRGLRDDLGRNLEEIHLRYGSAIRAFHGGSESLPGLENELARCLQLGLRPEEKRKKKRPISLIILGLLLLGVLVYFLAGRYLLSRKMSAYEDAVSSTPGLVLTGLESTRGKILATGLRDPMAHAPEDIAARLGIPEAQFVSAFSPYHSLEPELMLVRAVKLLEPPGSVSLRVDGDTLSVSGKSSYEWKTEADARARLMPGVGRVDFSTLNYFDHDWLAFVREGTAAPRRVDLRIEEDVLHFEGQAPQAWIDALPDALAALPDMPVTNYSALTDSRSVLMHLGRQIHGEAVFYEDALEFKAGQEEKIRILATRLRALADMTEGEPLSARVVLVGYTDASGTEIQNRFLRIRRAELLQAYLVEQGVAASLLSVRAAPEAAESGPVNPALRRVLIELALIDDSGADVFEP